MHASVLIDRDTTVGLVGVGGGVGEGVEWGWDNHITGLFKVASFVDLQRSRTSKDPSRNFSFQRDKTLSNSNIP